MWVLAVLASARDERLADQAALARLARGDQNALAELYDRHARPIYSLALRILRERTDAEDIVQEVFYELVEANRLLMPIDHVTGWLFRVARNRITDLFRKQRAGNFSDAAVEDEDGELLRIEDLLPSPDAGPEALYVRSVLIDELEIALNELPDEQREVFILHELEGRSFKELSAESGVNVNTLLSRKRYAVLHLRERLQKIYEDFVNK